ncbi:DUF6265 family protein [Caulobacter soli]|uniref:DUF6265 family protein n=1 Tax=Caulobacter soli TaxID=2708539 RepID=UPI0013ED74EA|nr:DUF6265 family protein [Caulobacter soli]
MFALILAAHLAASPVPSVPPPLVILGGRLAGCWEQTRSHRRIVEQWMRPDGGLMLGMSRTTSDGHPPEYEFLLIRETQTGLDYVARPSGQAEATFRLKTFEPDAATFENPSHDFPQRIIYRWTDKDTMVARIEGQIGGRAKSVDFPYKRCETGN